jgi:hypothetical protein
VRRRVIAISAFVLLAIAATVISLLTAKWPFTRAAVIKQLEELGEGKVEIGTFRPTYFPPGCVASNVSFNGRSTADSRRPITVKTMTVVGSYAGLFEFPKHIRLIRLDGMKVMEVPGGELGKPSRSTELVVDEIKADGAELDIAQNGARTERLHFQVRSLSLQHVVAGKPFSFKGTVRLPEPPGEVRVGGTAGPWNDANPGQTPISGNFILENADLGAFKGIGGKLAGKGQFRGLMEHIEIMGTTSMPQFVVKSSNHGLPLTTNFHAFVDGTNGDVTLAPVDAMLGESIIHSVGKIQKEEDPTTTVSDLKGHVRLENGVATFSRLSLSVPGASAVLHGTFNIETEKIDLHGMLRTDVKLSKATTGFQSFLLKVMEFMKSKKKEGAVVPVKITGTYDKPSFDVDAPAEK